jgi:hypothetical protein
LTLVPSHPSADLPTIKRAAYVRVTGLVGTLAAVTIYTAPTSRLYFVAAVMLCTVAGGADRTVTLTVRNTDDVGAAATATAAFTVAATGRTTLTAVIQAKPGSAITYETAVAGVLGAAGTYSIYLSLMEVGS